jgi:hypothetical protein
MKKKLQFTVICHVVILLLATVVSISFAGPYPERPVECIVPWGAGGGSTLFARAFNQPAERFFRSTLPIIKHPGASECWAYRIHGNGLPTVIHNNGKYRTVIGSALGTYKHTVEELNFYRTAAVTLTPGFM